MLTFDKPRQVSDVDLAFPANVVGTLLPAWETIPDEFREYKSSWCHIASDIFAGTFQRDLKCRPGIDGTIAGRHLYACLRSFQPKHEHKIAGVAYLMSLWFELGAIA